VERSVTCTLYAFNSHNNVAYKDEEGDEHTFQTYAFETDEVQLDWDGVQGDGKATHRVFFNPCDFSQSARCDLALQTSTK
jgi:hypothetical protein